MEPLEQPDPSDELDEILREAEAGLRLVPKPSAPPPASAASSAPPSAAPVMPRLAIVSATSPPAESAAPPPLGADVAGSATAALRPRSGIRYEFDQNKLDASDQLRTGFRLTSTQLTAMLLGVVTLTAWCWVILTGSAPGRAVYDAAYTDAGARYAIAVTSRRVEAFRREYHHVPNALAEVGRPLSNVIGYQRITLDRYRLTVPTASGTLAYDSIQPLQDFVGTSDVTLGFPPRTTLP